MSEDSLQTENVPWPQVILPQRKPVVSNVIFRTVLGLALFIGCIYLLAPYLAPGLWSAEDVAILTVWGWLPSFLLTDKYRHKYPQRYHTYLLASHAKAFLVMLFFFIVIWLFSSDPALSAGNLGLVLVCFAAADFLLSLPSVKKEPHLRPSLKRKDKGGEDSVPDIALEAINKDAVISALGDALPAEVRAMVEEKLEGSELGHATTLALNNGEVVPAADNVAFVRLVPKVNNVRLLDETIKGLCQGLPFGGYGLVHYTPLDKTNAALRARFGPVFFKPLFVMHFIWKRVLPKIPFLDRLYFSPILSWLDKLAYAVYGKNRVLSKSEMCGRLIAAGMSIKGSSVVGDEEYILFCKTAYPSDNKKPSYYAVVALEKVGMEGEVVRLHKVRSMYPYSEFMQQYMYETEGLNDMGKFKNDYRLSEYGPFIRKYWIDELPQLFDWLRGDIKLIGMRATSPQYLSLYPADLYNLYIQIKPGLVPPIFDEKTTGFEDIVRIEMEYLNEYLKSPMKADLGLFYKTFSDIFVRGVRSK